MGSLKINDADLLTFVQKVEKLKSEGLSVTTICLRLGVPRTTLADRLRKYRRHHSHKSAPAWKVIVIKRALQRLRDASGRL